MSKPSVPLVDLQAQYATLKCEIDAAIRRVIDSTCFINGPEVAAFEEEFAATVGAEHCVGVASGTAALTLALAACEIGPGDEVILPSQTFAATGEAVRLLHATPVFVDIEEDGYCLDLQGVAAAVTARTKAVIPVHIYGHPAAMAGIKEIADTHGLYVIEDAAQAHLACYDGEVCGSIGDLACFSFFPGKNLGAYGDAGAVTGNDEGLLDQVRRLRDHGRSSKYIHQIVGYGERLDALQAAVLRAKLPHLEGWTRRRNALAEAYLAELVHLPLALPATKQNAYHAFHLFVVQSDDREALIQGLRDRGVATGIHYPIPLHKQPAFAPAGGDAPSLPRVERAADRIVSLPLFPEMTEEQQKHVISSIEEVVSQW